MTTEMIERAIEIEGLLRIIRDGDPAPETFSLLRRKARELCSCIEDLDSEKPETQEENLPQPTPDPIAEEDGITIDSEQEEELVEFQKEKEEEVAEEIQEEIQEETEVNENEGKEEVEQELKLEQDDIILALDEESTDEETDMEDEDIIADRAVVPAKEEAKRKPLNLKGKFSLNDRFLYSRELFEGNMKMFDSTLAFLEGVDNFSVIEDYFFNELEWDKDNRFVASFIETLRPNFKS